MQFKSFFFFFIFFLSFYNIMMWTNFSGRIKFLIIVLYWLALTEMSTPDRRPSHLQTSWLKCIENVLKTSPVKLLKMFSLKIQTFPLPWLNSINKIVLTTTSCSDQIVCDDRRNLRGGPSSQQEEARGYKGFLTVVMTKLTVLGSQVTKKGQKIRIHA